MRNKLITLYLLSVLTSCNNIRESNTNKLLGKYINTFEQDAIHYVELKSDSTFVHYYKKGHTPNKVNKGIWSQIGAPPKNEIKFDTWIDYGYKNEPSCNGCLRFVKVVNGVMIFNFDLPNEMNFTKESP